MGWFRRTKRSAGATRKPTRAEARAAQRTAQAQAALTETEQQIHRLADQVRSGLKGSAH